MRNCIGIDVAKPFFDLHVLASASTLPPYPNFYLTVYIKKIYSARRLPYCKFCIDRSLSRFIGIDARYKKNYKITKKQLEYISKRVKILQRLTEKNCKEKIKSFV